MEYAITIISIISGGLFRRYWGGWFSPDATAKRIIGFLLPLVICLYVFGMNWLCLIIPSFVLFGCLMPLHGYGISMGTDPKHSTIACISVMLAQYGLLTLAAGIVWECFLKHSGGLFYAPMGCIIWAGYYLPLKLCVKSWGEYPKGNWFIDGHTCYGELILGATLIGGIPLAHLLAV